MMLECVLPLAFDFTSRLMSVPLPTTVDADVCDSLGELVNMFAGNFKALMPPETGISTPSVVRLPGLHSANARKQNPQPDRLCD